MYWTDASVNTMTVRDVIAFSEYIEEITEEHQTMIKNAVAEGVAEVMEEILDG